MRHPLPALRTLGRPTLVALLTLAAVVPATAAAGPRAASPETRAAPSRNGEAKRRAKALFDRAEKAYYLGRFREALALYSKAYEVVPLPGFLFNIGQCHRMLKQYEKAIFFYKGYLQASDASNRKMVMRLIQSLEQKLASAPRRGLAPRARRQAAPARRARPDLVPRPAPRRPAPKPLVRRWWFWTALAGGAAVVLAAVLGGVLGASSSGGGGSVALPPSSLGTLDRR